MYTTLRLLIPIVLCACVSSSAPPPSQPMGSSPPPPPAAAESGCNAIAGAWEIEGTCGDDECTIVQSDCTITQVACDSGSRSDTGTIEDAGSFTYTGVSGANVPATCSGVLNGDTISGSCNVANAATCTFAGQRR